MSCRRRSQSGVLALFAMMVGSAIFSPICGAQTCVQPPADLISWWPGDGNARDIAGSNHGAVIGGTFFAAARVGGGFHFDSNDDRVIIPHSTSLDVQPAGFTAHLWMQGVKNQPDPISTLLEKSHGWTDNTGWAISVFSLSGQPAFAIGDGASFPNAQASVDVLDGIPHHIAGTWESGIMRLYVDGVLQDSVANPTPTNNVRDVNIGFTWGGGTPRRFFRGYTDELQVVGRALSAPEIAGIAAAGSAGVCRPAPDPCFAPPSGLVSWWRAEGSAADNIGGHHGSLHNDTSFGPGIAGQAFEFDGVDDYLSVPDDPAWDFGTNDFTIDLWVNLNQIKHSMFIQQQSGADVGGFEFDYQPSSGMLVFSHNSATGGIARSWVPQANVWQHLAVTRNNRIYRLYVNGSQMGSELFDPDPVADVTGILRIGSWSFSSQYDVNGRIDELDILDRALSSEEIASIYDAGVAGKCTSGPDAPGFNIQSHVTGIPKPYRLAFSPTGTLFVGNNTNAAPEWALRVPAGGGSFSTYGNTSYTDPDAVAFDLTGSISGTLGSLLVGRGETNGTGILTAVLPDQSVANIEGPTALLGNPDDLVFDRTGRLLISDLSTGNVLVKSGGVSTSLFTIPSHPVTIAVDAANNIYTSASDGNVRIHSPSGTLLNSAFLTGLPDAPLDFGPGGCWGTDLYTVNPAGDLLRVTPGGVATTVGTGFGLVTDIAFGPDSILYMSLYNDSLVLSVSPLRSSPTPPTVKVPYSVLGVEGEPISILATATDPDAGDVLTVSVAGAPPSLALASSPGPSPVSAVLSGTLSYTDGGTYALIWSVTDGACGWTNSQTSTLTVLNSVTFFTKWTSIDDISDIAQGLLGETTVTLSGADITGGATAGGGTFNHPHFCPPLPNAGFVEFVGTAPAHSYTISFSTPLANPILHISSLASRLTFTGVTLTKLCGQGTFAVSDSQIVGSCLDGTNPNDANGTVRVNGTVSNLSFTAYWDGCDGFTTDGIDIQILSPIVTAVAESGVSDTPVALRLGPVVPNPFDREARFNFELPRAGRVELSIYNVAGRRVVSIVNQYAPAGKREVSWNGRDSSGRQVPSGMYFARLESEGEVQIRKLVMAR